jgi:hypothetical protein
MHHETPDAHLTLFEDLGDMLPDAAYIHVLVPVDLRNFSSMFSAASDLLYHHLMDFRNSTTFQYAMWYDPTYDKAAYLSLNPEINGTHTTQAGISIYHQIQEIQRTFDNITAMLPASSPYSASEMRPMTRQRRELAGFIGLATVAIIGALIGTYFGPYNQAQVTGLPLLQDMDLLLHVDDQHHELLDGLNKRVDAAFRALKLQENTYKNLDNHVSIWNAVVRQLDSRLHQFIDFVTQLQMRRLSMTWFTSTQMQALHQSVLRQAAKYDLKPLTNHLTDYFQLDVSYVRSENFITAILHVPASATDSVFKLFRYVPFPIQLSNDQVLIINAKPDIIAVGHNNHHRVLSDTQLNTCRKHYSKFICEMPLVTNTNFSTTCVGSLMDHNAVGIQTHCSLSTAPSQETVFQISNTMFAIYSPETFTGRGKCINGTALSALVSTISKVTVPPGCSFQLRNHVLKVPINAITTAEPWVQQTKWDTLEVPRQLLLRSTRSADAVHHLLADDDAASSVIQTLIAKSAVALNSTHTKITKDINAAVEQHSWYLVGMAAFCLFFCVTICCCLCRRYRNTTANPPMYPSFAHIPTTQDSNF